MIKNKLIWFRLELFAGSHLVILESILSGSFWKTKASILTSFGDWLLKKNQMVLISKGFLTEPCTSVNHRSEMLIYVREVRPSNDSDQIWDKFREWHRMWRCGAVLLNFGEAISKSRRKWSWWFIQWYLCRVSYMSGIVIRIENI